MLVSFFEWFVRASGISLGLVAAVSLVYESFETAFSSAMRVGNLLGLRMVIHACFIPIAARLYLATSTTAPGAAGHSVADITQLAMSTIAIVVGTIGMSIGTFELAVVPDVRHLLMTRMSFYAVALGVGLYFSPFQPPVQK